MSYCTRPSSLSQRRGGRSIVQSVADQIVPDMDGDDFAQYQPGIRIQSRAVRQAQQLRQPAFEGHRTLRDARRLNAH